MTADQPHLYQELDPIRWREVLCDELTALLDALLELEPNAVIRLGYANIKAPETVALLERAPSREAIDRLRAIRQDRSGLNFVEGGIGCANHFCELDWSVATIPRAGTLRRFGWWLRRYF